MLTTKEAAKRLKISHRRIRALIISGRLDATKHGHVWVIQETALDTIRHGTPGRPRKET